jgi:hypothetical protein
VQTARLALSVSANSLACSLKKTHLSENSSADSFFQCKQLGWFTVVKSSQCKQLGWRFLSVQTARLVHCSKLISVKTAQLALSFSANCSAGSLS